MVKVPGRRERAELCPGSTAGFARVLRPQLWLDAERGGTVWAPVPQRVSQQHRASCSHSARGCPGPGGSVQLVLWDP